MKTSFRIAVLVLLVALVVINLNQRRSAKEFNISQAERPIEAIPVGVIEIAKAQKAVKIRSAGKVKSTQQIIVIGRTAGTIEKILVKSGSSVKKGQLLAIVDDYYLREQATLASKAYAQDLKDLERLERVAETGAVTGQQLEQFRLKVEASKSKMEMAKTHRAEARITAPADGVVNQLFTKAGNTIGPGRPLCEMVGVATKIIEAGVAEHLAKHLDIGMEITLSDFGLVYPVKGTLISIGVTADRLGRVPIEVSFEDYDGFHQGLLVDLSVTISLAAGVYIPREALLGRRDRNVVFVVEGDAVRETEIMVGQLFDDFVEVLDGLSPGDQVVLAGNHLLEDKSKIKVIE